jgi:hypothetical protein
MDDSQIHARIENLVNEEHKLWTKESEGHTLSPDDQRRHEQLKVSLDQAWDLLRQRRALRDAHLDPDSAGTRPEGVVENYLQ